MIRGRIAYALALCAGVGFYIFYNRWLSFYVLLLLLVLPVASFVLCFFASKRVSAHLRAEPVAAQKGERVSFRLDLRNKGPLPLTRAGAVLTVRHVPDAAEKPRRCWVALGGRTTVSISCAVTPNYCGALTCTAARLRVCDYLGLFSFAIGPVQTVGVVVMPRAVPIAPDVEVPALPNDMGDQYGQTPGGNDPSEMLDLREYREGDSLRAIHWKLSGRTEGILVREFAQPMSAAAELLIDLDGTAEQRDILLDALYSLSLYLLACHIPHRLSWYDGEADELVRMAVSDEDAQDEALALLLRGRAGRGRALTLWLEREERTELRLLYLTACWDAPQRALLAQVEHGTALVPEGSADTEGAIPLRSGQLGADLSALVI